MNICGKIANQIFQKINCCWFLFKNKWREFAKVRKIHFLNEACRFKSNIGFEKYASNWKCQILLDIPFLSFKTFSLSATFGLDSKLDQQLIRKLF